ncbi:MAG: hypothetical protein HY911_13760 [Desulfobacterales bacterium]|nr:hypothetical protein [Desulfobacterales bacterium]
MKKLLVALLVLGLAAPAMAAEVALYGSFRTHLGYYDVSEEYGNAATVSAAIPAVVAGPDQDGSVYAGQGFDDAGTTLSLSGQSRFGAKAKVSDTLNAVFEAGLTETTRAAGQAQDIYLRLAYGVWNFGAGNFMFGKNYTPATYLLYSNQMGDLGDQGEAIMLVGGITYAGRQPQLRLTFGGFDIAAIEHNTNANTAVTGLAANDQDYIFPKFEASYTLNTPMFTIRPAVGWQTYDAVIRTLGGTEQEESVTSYLGALGVQLRFNPVYINMTGSYTVNAANYGISNFAIGIPQSPALAAAVPATGGLVGNILGARYFDNDVQDSELIMATFVVGAKLSPMLKVEAGMSYNNVQVDTSATATAEQTGFIYYVQAPMTVAPGVTITPEVGMVDRGDFQLTGFADQDQGDMTYGVVSFRVDF